jgi:hypothetical protein
MFDTGVTIFVPTSRTFGQSQKIDAFTEPPAGRAFFRDAY